MPENVPAPVPVRPEWITVVADHLRYNDECGPGPVSAQEYLDDAEVILTTVAPLIAAEAATRERARIANWLRSEIGRAKPSGREDEDDATLMAMADESIRVIANRIESLPAPCKKSDETSG